MTAPFRQVLALAASPCSLAVVLVILASLLLGLFAAHSPISENANAEIAGDRQGPQPFDLGNPSMDGLKEHQHQSQHLSSITPQETPLVQPLRRVQIEPGDTISTLLEDCGVEPAELQALLRHGKQSSELRRVFPGQWVEVGMNPDGTLRVLRIERDAANAIEWRREEDSGGFRHYVTRIEPEIRPAYASETIVNNLFIAGQRGGLGDEIILRLARIFRWDIDFVLDVRSGDSFELLYEAEYLKGKFHRYGDILAARFTNQGRVHTALRYLNEEGERDYFTPDGKNLRGAFLRAPVDFTRVSSGFSYKRRHPLFNKVRAHLGVDYAAPIGTPVKAAGKGKVITVHRKSSSGNYIEIEHAGGITTRYLHLSRFARGITPGTRVMQGDVIGFVGSTGWSTGPHLHYEYIEDGRHMDPRKIKVVRDSAISDADMPQFLAQTAPLQARLDSFDSRISVIGAN